MLYRNRFINGHLCINVFTNSKYIYKLINNFLDFNGAYISTPKIKINFHLDEITLKNSDNNKNFFYRGWIDKNNNLLFSIGDKTASITANPRTRVIKGTILNYKETSKEHLLELVFMQPLRFILAYYGLFFLHASVVCRGKDCIIISGPQDSGKSTIALTLAQNGFSLLSDDDCFIKSIRNQTKLFPLPTKMGLKDTVFKKYPELNKHTLKNYRYGGKRRFSLNSISFNSRHIESYRCKMMLFPKYKANGNIYMKKLPKEEALDRLAKESPTLYLKEKFKKKFWALYNLTSRVSAFELIYNDAKLDGVPKIVNMNNEEFTI